MNQTSQQTKEATLNINLNELVHSLLRDLAMACKKVAIYGSEHPSASRSIDKPFELFNNIFSFKKYVNINFHNGYLYILNIRLKDSVFNQAIIKFMQLQDISAILFERHMTRSELDKFICRFVKRGNSSDQLNPLSGYLKNNSIKTVEVNSEKGIWLFEKNKQYRGDIDIDFSVKNIILQLLPDDPEILGNINHRDKEYAYQQGIDFDYEIVQYLLPEKITTIPHGTIRNKLINKVNDFTAVIEKPQKRGELIEVCRAISRLIDYHPDRDKIVENLDKDITSDTPVEIVKELQSSAGKIKLESGEQIDNAIKGIFTFDSKTFDTSGFFNAFNRLLKTNQKDKAKDVFHYLIDFLGGNNADFRQKSLSLLIDIVKPLNLLSEISIFEFLIDEINKNITEKKETFEYSEFVGQLLEKCLKEKKFNLMLKLMTAIAQRRNFDNDVTIYDSMAIKKVFSYFNQSRFINELIDEMLKADFETAKVIRMILITAGSEEVAMELSHIISHPTRQVRQQTLKILGELGKASLKVFSQILVDDNMFEREKDQLELPDNKWYIIRNSIFVLGLLKDSVATLPLRLRINDDDIRVRKEIIAALEKIGSEDACDILMMMAEDPEPEIREYAVITIGLIGTPEIAPLLIDLAKRNPKIVLKAINALGKIGGKEAEEFLIKLLDFEQKTSKLPAGDTSKEDAELALLKAVDAMIKLGGDDAETLLCKLLEDQRQFSKLISGDAPKEEIKIAVVKALGLIGSNNTIKKIKEYKHTLSSKQKFFSKNSSLSKTIEEILSKH